MNLSFNVALVVMLARSNTLLDLRPLIPKVLEILPTAKVGEATIVGG